MAVCLLVRHGHSTANGEGLLAGWTPGIGLTDRGREQTSALVDRLGDLAPVRLVSSPLQRCLETAEPLAVGLGLDVQVDDDLGECHYGAWTGRRLTDLATEDLWKEVQRAPEATAFPGSTAYRGESLATMAARVADCLARTDAEVSAEHGPDAVWVAFSHGDPIKSALASAVGAGVTGLQRFHVDPGSVSVVRRAGDRAMVLATNLRDGGLSDLVRATSAPIARAGDAVVGGGAG